MITLEHISSFKPYKHQHIINILAIRFWGLLSQGVGNCVSTNLEINSNKPLTMAQGGGKPTNVVPKRVVKEIDNSYY